MIRINHHYFLLPPNPWAPFSRVMCFNLVFSVLIFLKFGFTFPFWVRILFISFLSFVWWVNYRKEFSLEGKRTFNLEDGVKLAIILFISSEVFFFFSFFWSYFHFYLSPSVECRLQWPPVLVESFDFRAVPLINTLVLMTSGATVTLRHHFMNKGKKKFYSFFLFSTVLLGLVFSYLQWVEYNNSFFSLRDSTFGTSFFILTGFHGMHVIIGSVFLGVVFIRSSLFSSCKCDSTSFEMASWYWHFVDVVWLFLYFCLYYLNG